MKNQIQDRAERPAPTLSISKAELAKLPAADYHGEIHMVDSPDLVDAAVNALSKADIIGFDTETRPSFKKGQSHQVALLQLATRTDCYLFRLNIIGLPAPVKSILEDESLLKIGVSLHDDFHNLHRLHDLTPKGFIDLQPYVKKFGIADNSLSRIYGILFDRRISKGQRLTNWESPSLTPAQQAYAAFDALSCIQIYDYLQSGGFDPYNSKYIVSPQATAESAAD
ncbi:MAG: 3'-5' exonuclease domain-containing protein 2 [Muribaculaceae bacterium]|nr:3'-5' exonuclease domain-containing protein 2 [Muribaculaceae bacterium]